MYQGHPVGSSRIWDINCQSFCYVTIRFEYKKTYQVHFLVLKDENVRNYNPVLVVHSCAWNVLLSFEEWGIF